MVGYLCTGYYIESDVLVTFIGLHELFRILCVLDIFWVSAHPIGSEITLKFLFFRNKWVLTEPLGCLCTGTLPRTVSEKLGPAGYFRVLFGHQNLYSWAVEHRQQRWLNFFTYRGWLYGNAGPPPAKRKITWTKLITWSSMVPHALLTSVYRLGLARK